MVSPMISKPRCGDQGKNGMLRYGGGVLNCRKRSSSLPLCGSTWHSTGQLIFNLAMAQVTTSTSSSYWYEHHQRFLHQSPQRKIWEAPSHLPEGKYPQRGLMGEDGDRDTLVSNPSIRPNCVGSASEGSPLIKQSLPGAKHTQWEESRIESRLCMPRSQTNHTQAVCITCRHVTFAGRSTSPVLCFVFLVL